jgi:DNA processing protein
VRLRDLPSPPRTVFVAGDLPRTPAVAVVGTRTPSAGALEFAHHLASELAKAGVAVLSGGAVGIDTAAHQGALQAGGVTVVVAPSSIDVPFPKENAALFEQVVASGGAFLSAHESGMQPMPHLFFQRNAFLAALSHALVVVETRQRGGARNAAAAARRIGRPVLAVPAAPWTKSGAGCILELKAGARLASSVGDVLAAIGLGPPERQSGRRSGSPALASRRAPGQEVLWPRPVGLVSGQAADTTDSDRDDVVELLRVGPLWPDEICSGLAMPAHRLQGLLLTLTLENVVVSEPSGRVALVNVRIY